MLSRLLLRLVLVFFNDTATTEIYTLSLHDALPILRQNHIAASDQVSIVRARPPHHRSEEHTSELQSLAYLVCRLLLEKNRTSCSPGARPPACARRRRVSAGRSRD